MSESQYDRVLDAINSLDGKFTAALNTGLAALNAAILALTEQHHRALLEQERRNSTFITSPQHEALVRRVDDLASAAGNRDALLQSIEEQLKIGQEQSFSLRSNLTGYLVSALLSGLAVTIGFLLTHAHP